MATGQLCIALEPNGLICRTTATAGSRWCPLHEEQQAKTLKAYKRYSGAFAAFDDEQLAGSPTAIAKCTTLQILIDWQSAAREKWALADRVIDARTKNHERFYRGGDNNHAIFIKTLEDTKRDLEQQMTLLDARAYKLVLEKQEASWLLVEDDKRDVCNDEPEVIDPVCPVPAASSKSSAKSKASPRGRSPSATSSSASSEDSSSIASTAPTEIGDDIPLASSPTPLTDRELVLAHLHSHWSVCHCEATHREDRLAVIDHLFRFVVARSPSLLVRAQALPPQTTPQQMLVTGDLSLAELRTLDKGLRFDTAGMLGPHVLRCAIMAVGRQPHEQEEDRVEVLGGWWWRRAPKRPMTIDEWSHFHSFIGCTGCALKVTRTFEEWLLCRTESHRAGRLARYRDPTAPSDNIDLAFSRLGLLVGRYSADGKRTLERVKPKARNLKPVFVERDTRCWLYFRMSRSNAERTERAITALQADRHVEVLLPTDTSARPWTMRIRTGTSPASRRAARWTDDRHFHAPDAFDVLRQDRFADETFDAVVLSKLAPPREKLEDFCELVLNALRSVEVAE